MGAHPGEETMLARYFPVDEQLPKQALSETLEAETAARLRTIQAQAASFNDPTEQPRQTEGSLRNGRYYSYKSEEDLPPVGREFFKLAAQLAGLSVPMLVRAVNMLEAHITFWQKEQLRVVNERRERSRSVMNLDSEIEQTTFTE